MTHIAAVLRVVTVFALLLAGCGPLADVDVAAEENNALGIDSLLAFLNGPNADVATLTEKAHVQARAANNIVAHIRGADLVLGTADDDLLDNIDELDAIPQVGPATIEAIDAYVRTLGLLPDLSVEGVDLTKSQAQQIVQLVNTATAAVLDDDVGLDRRAAVSLVSTRPFADILAVAGASYIGTNALTALRDYVIAHPQAIPVVRRPARRTMPAVIVSAVATDSTHVVVTWNRALDPTTGSIFDCFIEDPDSPLSCSLQSLQGAVVILETDVQEEGTDYTIEAADTLKDIDGNPVNPVDGRWVHFDGFAASAPPPPPPTPTTVDCASLQGGTFDGVAFSAAEECQAVQFLDFARFSEMGGLTEAGRRIAYDCGPSGSCGFRSSSWTRLSQFADTSGVGGTSMTSLKTAMAGWTQNGVAFDTVAHTWQNRQVLVDKPMNFDNVLVVRRVADQGSQPYSCVEVRDNAGAPNFLTACVMYINADSAPDCSIHPGVCLDRFVGARVSLRGTWRASNQSPGGFRLVVQSTGPGLPNTAVQP